MGRREKLIEKMRISPRNIRFSEVDALLRYEGFESMITTHHEYRGYVFAIEYLAKEPTYTVKFADFPEIITSGSTLADAFANSCEALDLHSASVCRSRDALWLSSVFEAGNALIAGTLLAHCRWRFGLSWC